jgi:hypothetical protein
MYITSNRPDQNRRRISISDIRTLWLSSLGSALEFCDFIFFVFFAAVIGKLLFPSDLPDWLRQLQTYSIFAVGYLARPLGGHRDGSLRRPIWPCVFANIHQGTVLYPLALPLDAAVVIGMICRSLISTPVNRESR